MDRRDRAVEEARARARFWGKPRPVRSTPRPEVVRPSRWQRIVGAVLWGLLLGVGLWVMAYLAVRWWVS
jgi:hypothetical protein